tara:strand:+ start:883 stop:1167 length:285 start_codon:yes stop_codon:yes gene_type:complete
MKTLKNYKKLFADYWGYHETASPVCWGCYRQLAVDIHHLTPRGMGGVKNNRLNRIDNLFPLCRDCHQKAHQNKSLNEYWKLKLIEKIKDKEFRG